MLIDVSSLLIYKTAKVVDRFRAYWPLERGKPQAGSLGLFEKKEEE